MNVWVTVVACVIISSASFGVIYYVLVPRKDKRDNNTFVENNDEEKSLDIITNRSESPPIIISSIITTKISILSSNISKLLNKGIIESTMPLFHKGYHWNRYQIMTDNYTFKILLSIGRIDKNPLEIKIEDDSIIINDKYMTKDTKINIYLSGAYFSEYIDDFIFIDDISKYNKKTGIYLFDNKPLFQFSNISNIICSIENRSIKLVINS